MFALAIVGAGGVGTGIPSAHVVAHARERERVSGVAAAALTPGAVLTLPFPDLPPTFHALATGKKVGAQMTVYLPRNYDPHRRHPLLLFLNGGDGGAGANPGVARALSEERDFICVNLPLFKARDPKAPGGEIIMRHSDAEYMLPRFRAMLAQLEATVPNIAPEHRILGGFSNGAHAIQGLLDASDGDIARRFSAFLFVEGGGRLEHYAQLRGKPFLIVSSSARSQPRAGQICAAAREAGAKATHLAVDVGGHAFPPSAYPAVRAWLRGPALADERPQ